jgi:Tfp pilus assembly protein PilV
MKMTMQNGKNFAFWENKKLMQYDAKRKSEGFSLVEAVIALAIFLIVVLGAYASITYAINYNTGNMNRAQALSALQQEVELIRSAKFTPEITDPLLRAGEKVRPITKTGQTFTSTITVDDDPFTGGIQDNPANATLKHITITVVLASPSPGWQTAYPATVVIRRVRGN